MFDNQLLGIGLWSIFGFREGLRVASLICFLRYVHCRRELIFLLCTNINHTAAVVLSMGPFRIALTEGHSRGQAILAMELCVKYSTRNTIHM